MSDNNIAEKWVAHRRKTFREQREPPPAHDPAHKRDTPTPPPGTSVPVAVSSSSPQPTPGKKTRPSVSGVATHRPDDVQNTQLFNIVNQPETRPISHDQLVAEVKEIYAGLVMVETKTSYLDKFAVVDETITRPVRYRDRDLVQTVSVSGSGRYGPKERSILPINLNGKTHHALADTMASRNFMSEAHATSIGAVTVRRAGKQDTFMNAIGKLFPSLGETAMEVSFPDDPTKKMWQTFSVVRNCAAALVMGDPFLRMTETLTKFRHRLKRVARTAKQHWRLCYIDAPHCQLRCSVAGDAVLANADTGSEIDLVSLEYATRRGWCLETFRPDDGYVELADGSIVKLAGYADALLDVGGNRTRGNTFYVLDGLQCDVLLGDETLYRLDAFNRHESLFVQRPVADGVHAEFHAIKWTERARDYATQILQDKLPRDFGSAVPSSGAKSGSFWKRLVGKVSGISAAEEIQYWELAFERALEIHETIETDRRMRVRKKIDSLTGDDLQAAKQEAENGRRRYTEKKARIQTQYQAFRRRCGRV